MSFFSGNPVNSAFCVIEKYQLHLSNGIRVNIKVLKACLHGTGARSNLTNTNHICPEWICSLNCITLLRHCTASKDEIYTKMKIRQHVRLGDLCACERCDIVLNFAGARFHGTLFINRFIFLNGGTSSFEIKSVLCYSQPVAVHTVLKDLSDIGTTSALLYATYDQNASKTASDRTWFIFHALQNYPWSSLVLHEG